MPDKVKIPCPVQDQKLNGHINLVSVEGKFTLLVGLLQGFDIFGELRRKLLLSDSLFEVLLDDLDRFGVFSNGFMRNFRGDHGL